MSFPQRIAAVRKELKLSQEKFGELANVSQRTVAFWESGERTPSYPVLCDLADRLGISIDYLLGRSDSPKIKKEPAATDSELADDIISRIRDLSDPELDQVAAFLSGLAAGREISAAAQAAPGQAAESPE